MNKRALEAMIKLAATASKGPFGAAIKQSIEVGVIVPSILATHITKAGYTISYRVGPGEDAKEGDHPHGAWVLVTKASDAKKRMDVYARAYSYDKADALVQACCAAMREEEGVTANGLVKA